MFFLGGCARSSLRVPDETPMKRTSLVLHDLVLHDHITDLPLQFLSINPNRYFLSRLKKVKKANGQIIACNEIFEEDVTSIKNYGVWIRYQSRTGFHNAYKEYREVSMNKAVDALYEEMASRHRVRAPCLQIIKIALVADADVKRDNTIQFLGRKEPVSFPVVNKVLRADAKSQKTTFKYTRPNFSAL